MSPVGLAFCAWPQPRIQSLKHLGFGHLQQRGHGSGDFSLSVAQQGGIGANRPGWNTGRELVASDVQYIPSPRLQQQFLVGVFVSLAGQILMANHLQIHQPVAQTPERRSQQQSEHHQSSQLQSLGHIRSKLPAARGDRFLIRRRHGRWKIVCYLIQVFSPLAGRSLHSFGFLNASN